MENHDPNINKEQCTPNMSQEESEQRVERSFDETAASQDLFAGHPPMEEATSGSPQATATAQSTRTQSSQGTGPSSGYGQPREKARQMASQAQQRAMSMVEQRKHQAADTLGSISSALHQTADRLSQSEQPAIGRYADTAAQKVDQFSQLLHEKDVNYFVNEIEGTARRHPGLFLGGAVALGFCCARFFKSSRQPESERSVFQSVKEQVGSAQEKMGSMHPGGREPGQYPGSSSSGPSVEQQVKDLDITTHGESI